MMKPIEDPTWPRCTIAKCSGLFWCDHIRMTLTAGRDADAIQTGSRICVPVVPQYDTWAEVGIDHREIMPGTAPMFLVKSKPFSQNEETIDIGLWSKGEGRFSIADVIKEWFAAQPDPGECPSTLHGYEQEVKLNANKGDQLFQKANLWQIMMNDMCLPCSQRSNSPGSIPNDPSGSNFGLSGALPAGQKPTPIANVGAYATAQGVTFAQTSTGQVTPLSPGSLMDAVKNKVGRSS